MSDWPEHYEELSRKTTAELQKWTGMFDAGQIQLVTMLAVVSALYDATSGLIDRELSNLLADIHADLTRQAGVLVRNAK